MVRQSFLKGAFILAFASLFIRVMGFIYQIIIVRLIGTEGIGIFNMVYPLYITALVIVTGGLPIALSKFVSEKTRLSGFRSSQHLLGSTITMLLFTSTLGACILLFFSPHIIRFLYVDIRVIPSFLLLVPTLLFCALSSAIKSFFQGMQDMRPTARAQLIEQFIRCIFGVFLVYLLFPFGLTWSAVGLSAAILLSEVGGFTYLWQFLRKKSVSDKFLTLPTPAEIIKLFSFGIPVTVTRLVSTILSAAEASIIPRQLIKAGLTLSQSASFYGELTGVAFTLLTVPSTLTFSLSTSILPVISEAQSKKDRKGLRQRTTEAINITLLAGVPCTLILYYWGAIITKILFKSEVGGQLLQLLSVGSIFLYLAQTTTGILQGIGYVKAIFFTTAISGLFRLSGIYFFGDQPGNYIAPIALSYVISFFVTALLNLYFIKRSNGIYFEPFFYGRLAFSGLMLVCLLKFTADVIQGNVFILLALVIINTAAYFLALFLTGDKYSRYIIKQLFNR